MKVQALIQGWKEYGKEDIFFPFLIPIFAVSYDKREIRNYALLLPFL